MLIPTRILEKIQVTPYCWEWLGALTSSGYSNTFFEGRNWLAHRLMYTYLLGEIPKGLDLDHLCRNRRCVNPAHLEPVTRSVNVLRGVSRDSHRNKVKTHCKRGHEFTAENTYQYATQRKCKTCNSLRQKGKI